MPDNKSTTAQFYKTIKALRDAFEKDNKNKHNEITTQISHSEAIATCLTTETLLLLYTLANSDNYNGPQDIMAILWHFIAYKILPIACFQSLLIIESLSTLSKQLKIINEQEMYDITNTTDLSHCLDLADLSMRSLALIQYAQQLKS